MLKKLLTILLFLAVINTAFLSWRYIALHANWVEKSSGICSLTDKIDCDKVLVTSEARAFYVPNALLGFSFFFGCFLWWILGRRLAESYHYHIYRTLVFWLFVATILTFRFVWLLIHLDALCPLCPWNHLLTWLGLIIAFMIWWKTPTPKTKHSVKPLIWLVLLCVGQFFLWLILWQIAHSNGLI